MCLSRSSCTPGCYIPGCRECWFETGFRAVNTNSGESHGKEDEQSNEH